MNHTKFATARERQLIAGARAIGWMDVISTYACTPSADGVAAAKEIIAEWDAAKEAVVAAINERDPKEIEQATVRG